MKKDIQDAQTIIDVKDRITHRMAARRKNRLRNQGNGNKTQDTNTNNTCSIM